MTPERWSRIKSLFHEALAQEPARRASFVARGAGEDRALADEVLALLAEEANAGQFLDRPALEQPAPGSGQQRFVIERELGEGGMGRVVAARDQKLGRKVAIKFLKAGIGDRSALRRFEQEARTAGALNHPNIITVYDVVEIDGQPCIVSELLEGKSLRELIKEGPLPIGTALDLTRQFADGLAAAHAGGVVHRDLKPENLFVLAGGRLKILDFGLAKLLEAQAVSLQTEPGALLGTPRYMSPEQVCARPAGAPSDVFAFGSIVYEMLAGRPAFEGLTTAEALAAILNAAPAPLPAHVPRQLAGVVRRCLEKDPARRFPSAAELAVALRPGAISAFPGRRLRLALVGALAAVATAVVALFATARRAPPIEHSSIAVLPFVNLSGEKDNEYFSDGITEELINALANVEGLRVASRTSTFAYKDGNRGVAQIGQELHVATVLEGSVRRERNSVRITAQLIDAASGFHLWSKSYHREMESVFAIEDEVARAIATSLKAKLLPETLVKPPTASAEAHDLYLRGRYFWNQRTPDGMRKAIAAFEKAIAVDPRYALAYEGLADSYAITKVRPVRPLELLSKAKMYVGQALAIDDSLAEAHATLGLIHWHLYEWAKAERELNRAIELKPAYAPAHHWSALLFASLGRLEEAGAAIERARALDPSSPLMNRIVAFVASLSGQPDRAIDLFKAALELDPTHPQTLGELATVYAETGRYAEALRTLDKVTDPLPYVGVRGYVLAKSGDRAGALRILAEMESRSRLEYVFPTTLAYLHIGLGDHDRAFAALEQSFADCDLLYFKVHPLFDALRADPRYGRLLARMNLR